MDIAGGRDMYGATGYLRLRESERRRWVYLL